MAKSRRITKISGNCCNSQTIDGCLYQTCTFHHQIIILILIATIIPIIITILNTYPHLHYQLTSASMKFFHCVQTLRETWFDELVWEAPSLNVPSVFGHCGWGDCKRMNKFPYWQGTFQKGASLSNSHEQLNFLITRLQIVHIARFWKLLYGNILQIVWTEKLRTAKPE